jgi:sirohydrochlorin cobaltochelatase
MACKNDRAILVVSFGTSYNDNRSKTIGAIERAICEAYRDSWEVRRAFTSRMIIKKLAERDGKKIDYVTDALERLAADGVRTVVVQPTHIMNGEEYDDIVEVVDEYRSRFDKVVMGKPLLTTLEDYEDVIAAIETDLVPAAEEVAGKGCSIVLAGHGSVHFANATYSQLQLMLMTTGPNDIFVTTVEGFPEYDDTIVLMEGAAKKVVLFPFMVVAGDHANNDIAGDDEDSLKSVLTSEGYEVHCVVKGLGEFKAFRDLFLGHVKAAMEELRNRSETAGAPGPRIIVFRNSASRSCPCRPCRWGTPSRRVCPRTWCRARSRCRGRRPQGRTRSRTSCISTSRASPWGTGRAPPRAPVPLSPPGPGFPSS